MSVVSSLTLSSLLLKSTVWWLVLSKLWWLFSPLLLGHFHPFQWKLQLLCLTAIFLVGCCHPQSVLDLQSLSNGEVWSTSLSVEGLANTPSASASRIYWPCTGPDANVACSTFRLCWRLLVENLGWLLTTTDGLVSGDPGPLGRYWLESTAYHLGCLQLHLSMFGAFRQRQVVVLVKLPGSCEQIWSYAPRPHVRSCRWIKLPCDILLMKKLVDWFLIPLTQQLA